MKYSPPENFEKIAYPDFSYLDTIFFMDISDYPISQKKFLSITHPEKTLLLSEFYFF